MIELDSCPFCGETPTTNVHYWKCGGDELMLTAAVKCKCGVEKRCSFQANNVSFNDFYDAFDTVIDSWNRRADNGSD